MENDLNTLFPHLLTLVSDYAKCVKILTSFWICEEPISPEHKEIYNSEEEKFLELQKNIPQLIKLAKKVIENIDEKTQDILERKWLLDFIINYFPPKFGVNLYDDKYVEEFGTEMMSETGYNFFTYLMRSDEIIDYTRLFNQLIEGIRTFQNFTVMLEGINFADEILLIHSGYYDEEDFEGINIHIFIDYKLDLANTLFNLKKLGESQIILSKIYKAFDFRTTHNICANNSDARNQKILADLYEYMEDILDDPPDHYSSEFVEFIKLTKNNFDKFS